MLNIGRLGRRVHSPTEGKKKKQTLFMSYQLKVHEAPVVQKEYIDDCTSLLLVHLNLS